MSVPVAIDNSSHIFCFAQVIVQAPVGILDYTICAEQAQTLHIGDPVRVPLGAREVDGYVADLSVSYDGSNDVSALRAVIKKDEERPKLPQDLIRLVQFASRYYQSPPGELLLCALPANARPTSVVYRLVPNSDVSIQKSLTALMTLAHQHSKGFTVAAVVKSLEILRPRAQALLRRAVDAGLLARHDKTRGRVRYEKRYTRHPAATAQRLTARQMRAKNLLGHLSTTIAASADTLRQHDPNPTGPLNTLVRLGLATCSKHEMLSDPFANTAFVGDDQRSAPKKLTADQAAAIAAIFGPDSAAPAGKKRPVLLHGITGSGKTEVYLQLIAQVLERKQTALMLVPEIALTPQLGAAFRARFGDQVATFHSGLTVAQRRDEWERIHRGEANIGLGARSALFLPLAHIGLIVVDEEHETSFKQDESPRYHARDLAIWRAQHVGADIILGSATPSLESWHHAQKGRYRLLSLPHRVANRPLPEVEVLALSEVERPNDQLLSTPMLKAIEHTLQRGEQVILFLNRRGFAPYIFCRDCGHSYRCRDCDVALTLHQRRSILLCHYCGAFEDAPDECVACSSHKVGAQGIGTERLESEIRQAFDDVSLVRLDRDTTRNRRDLEKLLEKFRSKQAQLLIGTQMVAKGHDFPGVTLVGVVSADSSLNFPDFRAAERTFQLLTQVAGRAGRGDLLGKVLVQAFEPRHEAIVAAQKHDFCRFADTELGHRKELGYPPYASLVLVRFEGTDEAAVAQTAQEQSDAWQARMADLADTCTLLGPAPAPLAKLRGMYRIHLLLRASTRTLMFAALAALPARARACHVKRIVDVDPVNLL